MGSGARRLGPAKSSTRTKRDRPLLMRPIRFDPVGRALEFPLAGSLVGSQPIQDEQREQESHDDGQGEESLGTEPGRVRADAKEDATGTAPPPVTPLAAPSFQEEEREDGEQAACHAEQDYIELRNSRAPPQRRYLPLQRCRQRCGACISDEVVWRKQPSARPAWLGCRSRNDEGRGRERASRAENGRAEMRRHGASRPAAMQFPRDRRRMISTPGGLRDSRGLFRKPMAHTDLRSGDLDCEWNAGGTVIAT